MDELTELFKIINPQETLMRGITRTKLEVSKIRLPNLEHHKKHCKYPKENKNLDESYQTIHKYQTLRRNLYKIWHQTKDKEVLKPIIYMKHLQPFDEQTNHINSESIINGEIRQTMNLLNQEIDKLLSTYEDLHTKEKDEFEILVQSLMTEME